MLFGNSHKHRLQQKSTKKAYWDQGDDVRNYMVHEAMRRDRFLQIMQSMHCADNTQLNDTDKFTKFRPLLDLLFNPRF